jgi:hypothetical protein
MLKSAQERLLLAASLYLIVAIIGTWLAIQQNLPARFMGLVSSRSALRDFMLLGTQLSAPLVLLVVQMILMLGLLWGIRQRACILGLVILGGIYIIGQLGEPALRQAFVPVLRPQIAVIVIANLLCPLGIVVFGLQARRDMFLS